MSDVSISRLPTVSVAIAAYNYEQYVGEAIESVLAQGYPSELLEVVVVDDGSTDGTASVVRDYAERHRDVVRLVQQPNSGPEAAVSRAMRETTGEVLAFLDADDAWMPGKLIDQVAVLMDRPEVGLVFGDMACVGGDGEPLDRPLILHAMPQLKRRAAAQVLAGNVASTSAIIARRSVISPMPPGIPIADWWFTLKAAFETEIAWITRPVVRYRVHGGGRSAGRQGLAGPPKLGPFHRDVQFKLGAMRILDLDRFTPAELIKIWEGAEHSATDILQNSGTHFAQLTPLVECDPARAGELLAQADAARLGADHALEARLVLRALAWDPYLLGGRARLHQAANEAQRSHAGSDPLAGARPIVVLADFEELVAEETMLAAYAESMAGANVTLAIDATRVADAHSGATELQALVERAGLVERSDVDLLGVVGRQDAIQHARLHEGAAAYYRRALRTPDAVSASMEFTPATLPQLRQLIDRAGNQAAPA